MCVFLFDRKGFTNTACLPISDNVAARTLTVPTAPIGGAANDSAESCTAACFASGYPLAGTEYSRECCTYYPLPQQFSELVRLPFSYKTAALPSLMAELRHLLVIAPWPAAETAP